MKKTNITIPVSQEHELKGFVLRDESFKGKRPVVLVLHGWTSSTRRFPERVTPLINMGYVCVMSDMRGHGNTGYDLAPFSRKDHLDDCISAYDYIKKIDDIDLDNISVLGSSYGSYLATLLSTKRDIKRLILSSPAQYQDEMFDEPQLAQDAEERRQYRLKSHSERDNKALKAVKEFKGNILVIEAENDEQVPSQVAKDYVKVGGKKVTHVLIKDADHPFYKGDTNQVMINELENWFKELE